MIKASAITIINRKRQGKEEEKTVEDDRLCLGKEQNLKSKPLFKKVFP